MTKTKQEKAVTLGDVQIDGEAYLKISNSDQMRPFFMSIVSHSNHWMFISSNGGLTAGRKNSEFAIFPYYTDDKITESAETTGSKSMFLLKKDGEPQLWEPFSARQFGKFNTTRNLYKNLLGNKIIFEEINHDLNLTFKYHWNSSDQFGFVKRSQLVNHSNETLDVIVLDGIQNILPSGVGSFLQNQSSNLVDAYKRTELEKESGLGIFALSAIIVDKAEPSEALKANIAYALGLENPKHLLSDRQHNHFRKGLTLSEETDVKAQKGAYFVVSEEKIGPEAEKEWMIIADVNKNHSAVVELVHSIKKDHDLSNKILNDIDQGSKNLIHLNASSDALQKTADQLRDTRHFSNTLFNIMRGGIFDHNYIIEKWDLLNYLEHANGHVFKESMRKLDELPAEITLSDLEEFAEKTTNPDLKRLCLEYMPLKFSRRHGDPSRPWNKFSINTRNEDGSKILDYEGNWRDIFQNWEALAISFPGFVINMIHKFLNATTFDGYNPYRVTKGGFDWESIEPDDPWSYIGYWGDHQIIYLQKLLEIAESHQPGKLSSYFDQEIFVYANVPYKIKSYDQILKDPKDTIDFDFDLDRKIHDRKAKIGADGALLMKSDQEIYRINFIEKILATLLAKLSNFIPEGGIWMNTQRPEWNDANNALVGNGVSMVTLYYLRRFLKFIHHLFQTSEALEVSISKELFEFYTKVAETFQQHQAVLDKGIGDKQRKIILDGLGYAGSDYRDKIYSDSFTSEKVEIDLAKLREFIETTLKFVDDTIRKNKREDQLFHAYNLMSVKNSSEVEISHLSEMLEGQVAVLSSGYLAPKAALSVLDALKSSALFREDQYSYLLYPNKNLPGFLARNSVPESLVNSSSLLLQMIKDNDTSVIQKDIKGGYHFNGDFKNAKDLDASLSELKDSKYGDLVEKDKASVLQMFEDVFDHKSFTGRSGTFYGYEGLGSIYWHMVSKLQLAVQECCIDAIRKGSNDETVGRLIAHYYEINEGIGVHKSPSLYGAFPTDPYSHTPGGKGAQQPGMTGQVKEDILSRFGELGVFVNEGKLIFDPCLLRKTEFLDHSTVFDYIDVNSNKKQIHLSNDSLAFTYCQIPIIYHISDKPKITVTLDDLTVVNIEKQELSKELSKKVFSRNGDIKKIEVHVKKSSLK